jgi:hypothetical protein
VTKVIRSSGQNNKHCLPPEAFSSGAISRDGLAVAVDDDRQLSIWDLEERWITKKVSPYSRTNNWFMEPGIKLVGWKNQGGW